jgi:hypothetical protein
VEAKRAQWIGWFVDGTANCAKATSDPHAHAPSPSPRPPLSLRHLRPCPHRHQHHQHRHLHATQCRRPLHPFVPGPGAQERQLYASWMPVVQIFSSAEPPTYAWRTPYRLNPCWFPPSSRPAPLLALPSPLRRSPRT